jgi:hypothetical protein
VFDGEGEAEEVGGEGFALVEGIGLEVEKEGALVLDDGGAGVLIE